MASKLLEIGKCNLAWYDEALYNLDPLNCTVLYSEHS